MTLPKEDYIAKYERVADQIEGWYGYPQLNPLLLEIDKVHQCHQIKGNLVEIGVHHGKSFIPLACILEEGEIGVAIDCFEDQQFNVDTSGRGDLKIFKENLESVLGPHLVEKRVLIRKSDSLSLCATDIIETGLQPRIFSIDGGHTVDATTNDLSLANETLGKLGVILTDDYFNENWPGVRFAVDNFLHKNGDWTPFFYGSNKLVLCRTLEFSEFSHLENEKVRKIKSLAANAGLWG